MAAGDFGLGIGVLLCGAGFILVALAVARGWCESADRRLLAALPPAPARHGRFDAAMGDISALGGDTVRLLFLAAGTIGLAVGADPRAAACFFSASLGSRLFVSLLKRIVRRERPDAAAHRVKTFTTSFPSGHTLMATAMLLLAAPLATVAAPTAVRGFALGLAGGLALAIGAARLLLRVHWPSDVLAAWLGGGAWAMAALLILRHLG
jgi:undecaprenyl-diphosphatase